jgi:hypothetical protein
MKLIELVEARKNPEMNTKQSTLDRLKLIRKQQKGDLFVTFTELEKVGINPTSEYNTPLGIYCYPIDYVIKKKMEVPFAPFAPFVNVLRSKSRKTWTLSGWDEDIKSSIIGVMANMKLDVSKCVASANNRDLWRGMYWAIMKAKVGNIHLLSSSILRKAGIDLVVDDKGKGIIHGNERNQAFFLIRGALEVVESMRNVGSVTKYSEMRAKIESVSSSAEMKLHFDDVWWIIRHAGEGKRVKWLEKLLIKYPSDTTILYWSKTMKHTKWVELEQSLSSNGDVMAKYCLNYYHPELKIRRPKWEAEIIATAHPSNVIEYGNVFIQGRWPELEHNILVTNPNASKYDSYRRSMNRLFNIELPDFNEAQRIAS